MLTDRLERQKKTRFVFGMQSDSRKYAEYEGEFFEGVPHGQGTWFGQDGTVYEGRFRYGRPSGRAVVVRPDGEKVEGEFLDMRGHGNLTMDRRGADGGVGGVVRVEGQFRHGMAHGKVRLWCRVRDDVIKVEGTYRMGLPHGSVRFVEDGDDGVVLGEQKFLHGRPLEGNSPKQRHSDRIQRLIKLLRRKILI